MLGDIGLTCLMAVIVRCLLLDDAAKHVLYFLPAVNKLSLMHLVNSTNHNLSFICSKLGGLVIIIYPMYIVRGFIVDNLMILILDYDTCN